ncbi:MAG: hypothetical protein KAW56_00250 [Candidatus Marinimicrobia bacterium]|nr:hypothetical protein [Candidatus Neomarinimicrobiota bacterium]
MIRIFTVYITTDSWQTRDNSLTACPASVVKENYKKRIRVICLPRPPDIFRAGREVRPYWGAICGQIRTSPPKRLRAGGIPFPQGSLRDGKVHSIIRRASTFNTKRIDNLYKDPHNKNN